MTAPSRQPYVQCVLLFVGLAYAFAWLIDGLAPIATSRVGNVLRWGTIMWAPAFAAIICRQIFAIGPTYSLLGPKKWQYAMFYAAPLISLTVSAYVLDDVPVLGDLRSGVMVTGFVLTLGEELGWRGFLQPMLAIHIRAPWRWLVTGIIWELWHLPLRWGSELLPLAARSCVTVALALLLGYAVERSRALIVPITFHLWANLLPEMSATSCYVAFAASVPLWVATLASSFPASPSFANRS